MRFSKKQIRIISIVLACVIVVPILITAVDILLS